MKDSARLLASVVDLNKPGPYVHWSIFQISVANLVLIAVMVVIFGAALLVPFAKGHGQSPDRGRRQAPRGWPTRGGPTRGWGRRRPRR